MYRLGEVREQHILGYARACLPDGKDKVLCWVRGSRLPDGKHGFAYITDDCLVLCWPHSKQDHVTVAWHDIEAWGVRFGQRGGPVLAVSTEHETATVQLPVHSSKKAEAVSRFLDEVAARAGCAAVISGEGFDGFDQPEMPVVRRERRSLAAHGRRVVMTMAGLLLILLGVVFASPFVPGPGTLTVLAGLGFLASEYDWAKDLHHWAWKKARSMVSRMRRRRRSRRKA